MFFIKLKSSKFLDIWGRLLTGQPAMAAALYPFVITSDRIHPRMYKYFVNHELIHFSQQKETLFIGHIILNILEIIYSIIKNRSLNVYLNLSTEKEAYDNMFDLEYLKSRKSFANFRYYFNAVPVNWNQYLNKKIETETYGK